MKASKICPKCNGRRFFHISRVQQTCCEVPSKVRRFDVTAGTAKSNMPSVFGGQSDEVVAPGPYETMVCAACGYAEWYVAKSALAALERLVASEPTVNVIEG